MNTQQLQNKYKTFFKIFTLTQSYLNMYSPLYYKCNICGSEYVTSLAKNAFKMKCCKECERIKKHNVFINHMKTIRPNIKVIGMYTENKKYIDLKCTTCGHKWKAMPFIFTRSNRIPSDCPECAGRNITLDKIKDKLSKLNPDIKIITANEEYAGMHKNITLKCNKCNNTWEIIPSKIFAKDRPFPVCQKCSSRLNVSHNQFTDNINNTKVDIVGYFTNYKNKISVKCKRCGHEWKQLPSNVKKGSGCPICAKKSSKYEQEIYDYIISLGISNIERNKYYFNDGKRFECDIYLPDYKIGIEFHGLYFHSNAYKEKNYHLKKLEFFNSLDIQLLQIFENEWRGKTEIIKSIIKRKLKLTQKIYARQCVIKDIDTKEATEFCNNYHLQGAGRASIKIGMYYNEQLVSVMAVGVNRFSKTDVREFIRYAIHPDYSVTGGMKKMLSYLLKVHNITKMESYIDRRFFNGNGYYNAGWNFIGVSEPNYFYFLPSNPLKLYSRNMFQKHKLHKKLKIFDDSLSEKQNMHNNGYFFIHDCGNIKVQIIL